MGKVLLLALDVALWIALGAHFLRDLTLPRGTGPQNKLLLTYTPECLVHCDKTCTVIDHTVCHYYTLSMLRGHMNVALLSESL